MHIDTRWKFQAMYAFREETARRSGMELIVYSNPEGVARNVNPFDHAAPCIRTSWKTQALKQALDEYQFDVAFGGARRDEEKSRAKERVFSFRSAAHRWDPKKPAAGTLEPLQRQQKQRREYSSVSALQLD